ncbi:hypothetical protein GALL_522140 [mine drainage metagenome]|uniref:Uncharacterized protein n=1 Tax=mine drainage metagenome TaxID=410659 RepID=A0A1J5P4Y5_9ZZZZ
MEERRQRRTLPAQPHIGRAEVPDHRHLQHLGQHRAIAALMRAAPVRIMRQRLAVKPHQLDIAKPRHQLAMRGLHHLRRRLHPSLARPLAKGRADRIALRRGVGPIGTLAKALNADPIGIDDRRIHPVQRGARHGAQYPDHLCQDCFPLRARADIEGADPENGRNADDLPPEIRLHARDDGARLHGRLHRLSGAGRGFRQRRGPGLYRL